MQSGAAASAFRCLGWAILALVGIAAGALGAFGYFDQDAVHVYPPLGRPKPIAAVNFSGDMGLRFLLGASTSRGLTQQGIEVVGITSPVLFRRHRNRAEVDAIIADGIREALARTGASQVAVIGQSYGADIVQTGLAHLPVTLRSKVAAIILILPGDSVYFRADPTGFAYRGKPESIAADTANMLDWAPVTCIYGAEETDSLCPHLHVPGATVIAMPGGHNIDHDAHGLLLHVLAAIRKVTPTAKRKHAPGSAKPHSAI